MLRCSRNQQHDCSYCGRYDYGIITLITYGLFNVVLECSGDDLGIIWGPSRHEQMILLMPAGPYNQYSPNLKIGEMDFCFFAYVFGCGLLRFGVLWLYLGMPIVVRGSVFIKFLDTERSIICNRNTFPILGMEQVQQQVFPNP